jgi:hypothetical protein
MMGRWLLLGVFLLPLAAAQQPLGPVVDLQLEGIPEAFLRPDVDAARILGTVTVRCDALVAAAAANPSAQVVTSFVFNPSDVVVVAGPLEQEIPTSSCLQAAATTASSTQEYVLAISRQAPGLVAMPAQAQARLVGASAVHPGDSETVDFHVTADYYSATMVKVPSKLMQCKPGQLVPFVAEITNFGNARTQYQFEVTTQPGGDWNILLPPALLLESSNSSQGNATGVAVFQVACAGSNNEGGYQITITPSAADDPGKEGDPLTLNFLARSRGAIPVPGPSPLLGMLLLGLALLVRRHP